MPVFAKKIINFLFKVVLPITFGGAILWWMYRGFSMEEVRQALQSDMHWSWMLWSLPFGVLAQVFRALRWRQALEPMGETPRRHTCINAIFLSYASSLIVPRLGEVLRCGVLKRYESTNFSRSVGTVVCERVIDTLLILLLTLITVLWQVPVFLTFMERTGVTVGSMLSRFSLAGYAVTAMCGAAVLVLVLWLLSRLRIKNRLQTVMRDMLEGLLSIRMVRQKALFLAYSVGIWLAYYLHFYLTFYCFDSIGELGSMAALVAFVVGSFAVLVPTPNGAGPWHFAVKTVLVLYGIGDALAALFVLVVHTIQTLLVAVLGLYALVALSLTKPKQNTNNI